MEMIRRTRDILKVMGRYEEEERQCAGQTSRGLLLFFVRPLLLAGKVSFAPAALFNFVVLFPHFVIRFL